MSSTSTPSAAREVRGTPEWQRTYQRRQAAAAERAQGALVFDLDPTLPATDDVAGQLDLFA